jgi:hypothetical protein
MRLIVLAPLLAAIPSVAGVTSRFVRQTTIWQT